MKQIEHDRGSLLGLATGDALGTTLEFNRPGSFKPIKDMVGEDLFTLSQASGQMILRWRYVWQKA